MTSGLWFDGACASSKTLIPPTTASIANAIRRRMAHLTLTAASGASRERAQDHALILRRAALPVEE